MRFLFICSFMYLHNALGTGADIDKKDWAGRTALMMATQATHRKVVSILLNNGANLNSQDDNGYTALEYAVKLGTRRNNIKTAKTWSRCEKRGFATPFNGGILGPWKYSFSAFR